MAWPLANNQIAWICRADLASGAARNRPARSSRLRCAATCTMLVSHEPWRVNLSAASPRATPAERIIRKPYYEGLGKAIGRSAEGARAVARRQRRRVETGNHGRAWVLVDVAELHDWQPPGHRMVTAGHDRSASAVPGSASGGAELPTEALLAARSPAAAGENRVLRER